MAKQRYTSDELIDMYDEVNLDFAEPGGRSALRAGKRCHPCPTCGRPNRLTKKDIQLHYQCDQCADEAERGY